MRYLWAGLVLLLTPILLLGAPVGLAQSETICPPGRQPHFEHGFAFLKSQLGQIMGEPLECERYDSAGNASQQTTTGQAFYHKDTNTPTFTTGGMRWAWTPAGVRQWTDEAANPEAGAAAPVIKPIVVKVVSYNVLFGAGADPEWERAAARLSPFAYPGNRLPQILSVIKAVNPDILAVQEAASWDSGSPPIVAQVAKELGMNYFLAPTGNKLHLALFTKFKIVETENLSEQMGNVGALRATLATPQGHTLHVFVVHLDPFAAATRANELAILTQATAPYLQAPTLLMGDMNFYCLDDQAHCNEYQVLSRAGWQLALAGKYKLDQIWISPVLAHSVEELAILGASFEISDHLPIGALIEIPFLQ